MLLPFLFASLCWSIASYILVDGGASSYVLLCIFALYSMVYAVPVIYIHYHYHRLSDGIIYTISSDGISINKNDSRRVVKAEEIKSIKINGDTTGFSKLPSGVYYYAEIIIADDEKLLITCLHSYKIEGILKELFIGKNISFDKSGIAAFVPQDDLPY